MASCIVDIEFSYNKDNEAFPHMVYVTGLTREKNTYTREIFYNWPVTKYSSLDSDSGSVTQKFGEFDFLSKNQKLFEILTQFEYIFVKNKVQREFLHKIFSTKKNIFTVEP